MANILMPDSESMSHMRQPIVVQVMYICKPNS